MYESGTFRILELIKFFFISFYAYYSYLFIHTSQYHTACYSRGVSLQLLPSYEIWDQVLNKIKARPESMNCISLKDVHNNHTRLGFLEDIPQYLFLRSLGFKTS